LPDAVCTITALGSTFGISKYPLRCIDGLTRGDLFDIASNYVAPSGIIICDNAEDYGFYEGFKDRGFSRVDFYGSAPGILLPHCTSIFFAASSFVFDPAVPIRNIAKNPWNPSG
jgi:hypothetical protein